MPKSNYIDKIIYINLEKRTDRREQIEKELSDFDLPFERFNAILNQPDNSDGCASSHLQVLKIAKENNYKNILILEDDFTFLVSKQEFEDNIKAFFESENGTNFDVCFLSYNMIQFLALDDSSVVNKVIEAQTASGYLVNGHYYQKLIDLYEYALPLLRTTKMTWIYTNDQIWKQYQKTDNWYYFKQRIGRQRPGLSDNGNGSYINTVVINQYGEEIPY